MESRIRRNSSKPRIASRSFRCKSGNYANAPPESMESKNIRDFLYEIARPFTSCNLCKKLLLTREIARRRQQAYGYCLVENSVCVILCRFVCDRMTLFNLSINLASFNKIASYVYLFLNYQSLFVLN